MALSEFRKILKEEGLEEIVVKPADKFNHNEMECFEVTEGNGGNEGKVVEVVFKGYKLNGKLLRPAKVKVYKKIAEVAKEQVTQKRDYM